MYYIFAEKNNLNGAGQCECLNEDVINIEVDEDLYNDYTNTPDKYILGWKEIIIDVPEFDEDGNPIMVIVKEEIQVPIYDEETGEIIGYETKIIEKEVQKTHEETVIRPYPIIDPDYEEKQKQKEKERIGNLTCTKRVFALMLQELGISYGQLKELISTNEQAQLEWDLCVELERKNPMIDLMAGKLGITPEQLDKLFQYANGEITIEEFKK